MPGQYTISAHSVLPMRPAEESAFGAACDIPLTALRGTILVSDEDYAVLDSSADFRRVGNTWGAATALFLRGLGEFLASGTQGNAKAAFAHVLGQKTVDSVREMIQQAGDDPSNTVACIGMPASFGLLESGLRGQHMGA